MTIQLLSHPIYTRPLRWWISSNTIVIILVVLSAIKQDWFGAIVMALMWWVYIWYSRQPQEPLAATITETTLSIDKKVYNREDIKHVSIEIDEASSSFLWLYIQPMDRARNTVYGFAIQDNKAIAAWIQEIEAYVVINPKITLDMYHTLRRFLRI